MLVQAEQFVFYGFNDTREASNVISEVAAGEVTFGPGILGTPGYSGIKSEGTKSLQFGNSGLYETSEAAAKAADDYFSFSVTIDNEFKADFSNLSFYTLRRSDDGAGAPDSFSIYTSHDGYTASVGSGSIAPEEPGSQAFTLQTVDFANALQSITGTIEFRVYLWPSQGHGAVNTRNLRIDAISLAGKVDEKTSLKLIIMSGLLNSF